MVFHLEPDCLCQYLKVPKNILLNNQYACQILFANDTSFVEVISTGGYMYLAKNISLWRSGTILIQLGIITD